MASQALVLPTLNDGTSFYTFRTTLDGADYNFEMQWSTRESRWYVSIFDSQGLLLLGSKKLLSNWPLLRFYHYRALPKGELLVVSSQSNDPPGFDELAFGARCQLCYFPDGVPRD